MTAVDILLFIVKHKKEFPKLKGQSPIEVLGMLPDKDPRYKQGEAGFVSWNVMCSPTRSTPDQRK